MELKEILQLLSVAVGVGVAWGLDKRQGVDLERRINELGEVNQKQWREIDKIKEWNITHDKEADKARMELEIKIATLHGIVGKLDEKLDSISKKIDELIKRVDGKNKQ